MISESLVAALVQPNTTQALFRPGVDIHLEPSVSVHTWYYPSYMSLNQIRSHFHILTSATPVSKEVGRLSPLAQISLLMYI